MERLRQDDRDDLANRLLAGNLRKDAMAVEDVLEAPLGVDQDRDGDEAGLRNGRKKLTQKQNSSQNRQPRR